MRRAGGTTARTLLLVVSSALAWAVFQASPVAFSASPAPSPASAPPALVLDLGAGVKLETVRIPAGRFTQGSSAAERGRGDDEDARDVTLSDAFYMGVHEVTRGQFARFVAETRYRTESEKGTSGGFGFDGKALTQRPQFNWKNPGFPQDDSHPVVLVTYDDAVAFTTWLARKTGRAVSLPTEAQWEYAARGGSKTRFPGGDSDDRARALGWIKANAGDGTRPVGQKKVNGFGLFDTVGNAWEWCRDWYAPYAPGPLTNPEELRSTMSDKPRRVLRGGSWLKDAANARPAARYRNTPGSRNADNGFRVAVSTKAAAAPVARITPTQARPRPAVPPPGDTSWLGGVFALLCGVFSLGSLVLAVRWLLDRRKWKDTEYPGIKAKLAEDGVWFDAPAALRRHGIQYRCVVGAGVYTWEATAEGGRQYVYTGGRPTSVEVLAVVPPDANAGRLAAPPGRPAPARPATGNSLVSDDTRDDEDDDNSSNFAGYPSAY